MSTVLTLLILFVATLTHATLGFGTASVAMPLLALIVGVRTATPLVAFVMLTTTTIIILWGSWRSIDLWATWRLLLASVVGTPLGIVLLKGAPEELVKGILGILLIAFSLYSLIRPRLAAIERQEWAYGFGCLGGVFGGAFNMNAPPLVVYGVLRRWPPERFRATLQGYFVPASALIWAGHGRLGGLWTASVVQLYLLALPLVLLGIVFGTRLNHHIPADRFARLLYMIFIGLGILLLL